jgi:hypothetical protein
MKLTLFPSLERIALGKKLRHLVAGLLTMPLVSLAAGPTLNHPTSADFVALTIPYFDWDDHVPHPYEGTYEIQIDDDSDCSSPFDTDTVPAFISHYSPTAELSTGTTYYWRVRHVDISVSGRVKPTSRERVKTYHFERGFASGVTRGCTGRDERTQSELTTTDHRLGRVRLVAASDSPGAGAGPFDGEALRAAGGGKTSHGGQPDHRVRDGKTHHHG